MKRFKDALSALNSLQSNAQTIDKWLVDRRTNPEEASVKLREEMVDCLSFLDLPINKLSFIHVAGTKGKGSTCAFVESILRSHGFSTGLYTSPHLVSIRERIRINGKSISEDLFAEHFWGIWDGLVKKNDLHRLPPYFRFLTLVAFRVFLQEMPDVVILETGLGGRSDATNVIEMPVSTGITSLGYDHMNVLGHTLAEIAREKAGIFKPRIQPLSIVQPLEPLTVLKKVALEVSGFELQIVEPFSELKDIRLGLAGVHQYSNAALAVALSNIWLNQRTTSNFSLQSLPPQTRKGLEACEFPGRAQLVVPKNLKNTTLFVDGAHTVESMVACMDWFLLSQTKQSASNVTRVLVFNCSLNRKPGPLLKTIKEKMHFDRVYFTSNSSGKSHILKDQRFQRIKMDLELPWQSVLEKEWAEIPAPSGPSVICRDLPELFEQLNDLSLSEGKPLHVLATGSLYLAGGLLDFLEFEIP